MREHCGYEGKVLGLSEDAFAYIMLNEVKKSAQRYRKG